MDKFDILIKREADKYKDFSAVVDYDDLIQVGNIALLNAKTRYKDVSKFYSYASVCIRRAIRKEAFRFAGIFTLPKRATDNKEIVKQCRDFLKNKGL